MRRLPALFRRSGQLRESETPGAARQALGARQPTPAGRPGAQERRRSRQLAAIYVVLWLATWYLASIMESVAGVSLWFLPAGLRFVCLLVLGWPGVLLELTVQFVFAVLQITSLAGVPITDFLSTNTLWRLYNLLAPLAANALLILPLRRSLRRDWDLTRPADSTCFGITALAVSALSGLSGAFGLLQLGAIEAGQFAKALAGWTIGDLIGILTLAPLLLVRVWPAVKHYRRQGRWRSGRPATALRMASDRRTLLIVVPALLVVFAIPWPLDFALHFPQIALLLLLPLAGVALQRGLRGTVLAVLLLDGGLVLLLALFGQRGAATHYQLVMIAIALVGLWLGAAVERYNAAEASRRASERSFRATFEQAAVGIALISCAGRWLNANQTLCAILGYSFEQLANQRVAEITHPDDLATVHDMARRLLAGETSSDALEHRYRRQDGRFVWVKVTLSLARRNDGAPEYYVAIIEDIERSKGAESALQLSESALTRAAQALRELNAGLEQRVAERTGELQQALAESMATRQRLQVEIDEHRRTEIRLRNSEARLQLALKGAGASCYEWDLANAADPGDLETPATGAAGATEFAPASYADWCRAVHPNDVEHVRTVVDQALAQGADYEVEWRVNLPAGDSPRWMISRGHPLRDEAGRLSGYLGLSLDISERKRADLELEQYRDDLKGIVTRRTAQLLIANAEQRRLNRALRLLSDCNVTLAHAKDENQLLSELCRVVVEDGGYLIGGVWFARHDAAKSAVPVAQYGAPEGVHESVQISWDGDQEIGRGPAGTAIRTGTTQIVQDCANSPRLRPWREIAARLNCRSIVAFPLIVEQQVLGAFALYSEHSEGFDDNEIRVLEELASNLSYGLQSLRARDELEQHRRRLEERVVERTQQIALLNADLAAKASDAESANRAKSGLLSTMSHEIRTPLSAVVGLTGLLANSPLTRRQRDYADKIQAAAQTLRTLIDDILDFSKIEAGALHLEQQPFSLDAILRAVAAVASVGTGDKPVETLFDVPAGIPEWLLGDAMRIQQILVNLVGNAAKFTQRGEIVVAVRCLARDEAQVTLEFAVRDTGIGIPPEHLERIFDDFAQGSASTSRLYGGSGLGLAISARLAALMGSRIAIASRVGEGSEFGFAVTLPLADEPPAASTTDALPGLRVLIVDDHPLARALLRQTCTAFGWTATAVDGAAAGLAELRRGNAEADDYDILLLDWRMPGTDGIQMLRQAQAAPDIGLPLVILMVPTYELEQAIAASDDLYVDSLLTKPATPAALLDAVTRAHSGELTGRLLPDSQRRQSLAGMRLLVAEDNELNQLVVEQMLSRAGAEVVVVADGAAAVEALRSPDAHFDALLMDLEMPVLGGYAAAKIIRDELGRVALPIIAVTAYAQAEDRERSRRAGMAGHIVKPIDEDDLLAVLVDAGRATTEAPAGGAPAATPAALAGELPGIDLAAALKAFGGNEKNYAEILRRFVVGHRGDIHQARALFDAGDAKGAASLVHGLCGVASIVHAMEMAHLARATEGAIGNRDAVPPLLDELQGAMDDLEQALGQIDAMIDGA